MTERKEITLAELAEMKSRQGPNVTMPQVEAHGICVIKDKDGNIKSTMEITSNIPENDNATS